MKTYTIKIKDGEDWITEQVNESMLECLNEMGAKYKIVNVIEEKPDFQKKLFKVQSNLGFYN